MDKETYYRLLRRRFDNAFDVNIAILYWGGHHEDAVAMMAAKEEIYNRWLSLKAGENDGSGRTVRGT